MANKALGIDPGLANTGWAIVSRSHRGAFDVIDSGIIETDKKSVESIRIHEIYNNIQGIVYHHKIDFLAVERVFFNNNPSSCLSTAGVSYICVLAAEQNGINSMFFTPQQVKSAVGCGTRADKKTVSRFVGKLTGAELTNWHTADAAATAIAGLLKARSKKR